MIFKYKLTFKMNICKSERFKGKYYNMFKLKTIKE